MVSILNTKGSRQISGSDHSRSLRQRQSEVGEHIKLVPDLEIHTAVTILTVHIAPELPGSLPSLRIVGCRQETTFDVQALVAVRDFSTDVANNVPKFDAHVALDTRVVLFAVSDDKHGQGDGG